MTDDIVIKVRGLRTQFGAQVVHDELDLDIRAGEVVGIVGGSGTGKSVLLRTILGLNTPRKGDIEVLSEDIRSASNTLQQRCGVLFQNGALFSSLTVAENVALPLEEHTDLDANIIDFMVKIKLELVGLRDAADKYPAQISGGMKKWAGLARALALDPKILFYDEPSAGLDPVTSAAIDQLMVDLTRKLGVASIVVTHEMDSAFTIADRMAMLHKGRMIMVDTREAYEKLRDYPQDRIGELTEEQQLIRQFLRGDHEGPMTESHTQNSYEEDLLGADLSKLTGGRAIQTTRRIK